jgi:hypothetical protein
MMDAMSAESITAQPDIELLPIPDAAQRTGLDVLAVEQLVKDGALVLLRDDAGRRCVPAQFLVAGGPVKHLPAVITLLRDGGFSDVEIVTWLYREDLTLPGSPIVALRENRGTEVKRRAQASAL